MFGTTADDEVVSMHEQYYIQATSSRADDRTRVLKHDETFAVFDRFGDLQPVGLGEQGIYHDGTRFLSRLELRIGGRRPLMLSSTVKKENDLLTVDLATPDLKDQKGEIVLQRGTLHVFRTKFLWRSCCYERLRISNFATTAVDAELALSFSADYADIFEVRGAKRERRGARLEPVVERARRDARLRGARSRRAAHAAGVRSRARRSDRRAGAVPPAAALARHRRRSTSS